MEKNVTFSNGKIRCDDNQIVVTFDSDGWSDIKKFKVNKDIISEIYWIKDTKTADMKWYHLWLSGISLVVIYIICSYFFVQFLDSEWLNTQPILSDIMVWVGVAYFILGGTTLALMFIFELLDDWVFIATKFHILLRSKRVISVCIKSPRKERLIPVRNKTEAEKLIEYLKSITMTI